MKKYFSFVLAALLAACGSAKTGNLELPVVYESDAGVGASDAGADADADVTKSEPVIGDTSGDFAFHPAAPVASTEGDTFGQIKQPIYFDSGYGFEGGTGTRCDSSWQNSECWLPDFRPQTVSINMSVCTAFTRNMMTRAITAINSVLPSDSPTTEDTNGTGNIKLVCNNTETLAQNSRLGRFQPVQYESHSAPQGTVRQFRTGTITIFQGKINTLNAWQCGGLTEDQCSLRHFSLLTNVIEHELGHAHGLGHRTTNTGDFLLDLAFPDNASRPVWSQTLKPTTDEKNFVDCYTPGSGTGKSC